MIKQHSCIFPATKWCVYALLLLAVMALCPAFGSAQSCTDMTNSVRGSARVGSDGFVSATFTNNAGQAVHVFYTFKENGEPSNSMANAGAINLNPGQTRGGEGAGLYTTQADKNPAEIYWYAVLKSDYDQNKPCAMSHSW